VEQGGVACGRSSTGTDTVETGEASERVRRFRALFADPAAFRVWYERTFPIVYGFLFARCGGMEDVAAELTQQTFVDAVRQRAGFSGAGDPVTWVCGIARHKLADHYRRLEAEERRHLRLVEGYGWGESPGEGEESREAVERALSGLPAMQRAVLVLHYLDGLSVAEVGRTLGRSESAAESLLTRARLNFRRRYGSDGGGGSDA
jgi:RNA polymerase sigma-70 factor (ECF subfamily)